MSEIWPNEMNEARVLRRAVISLLAAWLVKPTDMNVHPTGVTTLLFTYLGHSCPRFDQTKSMQRMLFAVEEFFKGRS